MHKQWLNTVAKRKEHDVQSAIIDFLVRACGMEVIRFNSGATLYGSGSNKRFIFFYTWFGKIGAKMHKGVPDVYAFCPKTGIAAWIEVKKDGKSKERPEQRLFREAVAASVEVAIVASSVDEVAEAILPVLAERGKVVSWMGHHHLPNGEAGVLTDGDAEARKKKRSNVATPRKRAVNVVRNGAGSQEGDSDDDQSL